MSFAAPASAVIPCYRGSATISRALDSVAAQSAPPVEVIVVDDGSEDGSAQIAARHDVGGVRVIRLERNAGPGMARNAGWQVATQPYIAFLDADDAWHPRKIELQLDWMEAHPECVLSGHAVSDASRTPSSEVAFLGKAVSVSRQMLLASNRFQTSSVMLRRSIPQRFAEGKRYCEDYLLWLEIVLGGGRAHYLDAPLAVRFKPVYGAGGASGRLWDMQAGELDALARVRRAGLLGLPGFLGAATWSWMKFARRLALAPSR